MRYLAELPWAPDAILSNPQLSWRVENAEQLVVSANIDAISAKISLHLDSRGLVDRIFAPDRPRSVGKLFVPTPWTGRFFEYKHHAGRLLPFRGEVAWVADDVEELCWEGEILSWSTLAPFDHD